MSQIVIEFNSIGQLVSECKSLVYGIVNFNGDGKIDTRSPRILVAKSELPSEIVERLTEVGYKTLNRVARLSESELMAIPGIGHAKRRTINRVLYANNLPVIGF